MRKMLLSFGPDVDVHLYCTLMACGDGGTTTSERYAKSLILGTLRGFLALIRVIEKHIKRRFIMGYKLGFRRERDALQLSDRG